MSASKGNSERNLAALAAEKNVASNFEETRLLTDFPEGIFPPQEAKKCNVKRTFKALISNRDPSRRSFDFCEAEKEQDLTRA